MTTSAVAEGEVSPEMEAPAQEPPGWLKSGRIPCLDGLRALAVVTVVACHASMSGTWLSRRGADGVDCFFVLSGFLITLLMLRERDRSGRVDVRAFYVRRALRIWPAYYVYLLFIAAFAMMGLPGMASFRAILLSSAYLSGVVRHEVGFGGVGHTWTLSVEEFFYLGWPVAFAVATTRRRATACLLFTLAVLPFARYAIWRWSALDIDVSFPARTDGLAVGCLMAIALMGDRGARLFDLARRRGWALLALSVAVFVASQWFPSGKYVITIKRTVDAFAMAGVVLACLGMAEGLVGKAFEWRPVVWLGTLSYSLYLWHMPFVGPTSPLGTRVIAIDIAISVVCAVASHYLVERPFLKWKDQIGRVRHG